MLASYKYFFHRMAELVVPPEIFVLLHKFQIYIRATGVAFEQIRIRFDVVGEDELMREVEMKADVYEQHDCTGFMKCFDSPFLIH